MIAVRGIVWTYRVDFQVDKVDNSRAPSRQFKVLRKITCVNVNDEVVAPSAVNPEAVGIVLRVGDLGRWPDLLRSEIDGDGRGTRRCRWV